MDDWGQDDLRILISLFLRTRDLEKVLIMLTKSKLMLQVN